MNQINKEGNIECLIDIGYWCDDSVIIGSKLKEIC